MSSVIDKHEIIEMDQWQWQCQKYISKRNRQLLARLAIIAEHMLRNLVRAGVHASYKGRRQFLRFKVVITYTVLVVTKV